jgi:hypothetical protein
VLTIKLKWNLVVYLRNTDDSDKEMKTRNKEACFECTHPGKSNSNAQANSLEVL